MQKCVANKDELATAVAYRASMSDTAVWSFVCIATFAPKDGGGTLLLVLGTVIFVCGTGPVVAVPRISRLPVRVTIGIDDVAADVAMILMPGWRGLSALDVPGDRRLPDLGELGAVFRHPLDAVEV